MIQGSLRSLLLMVGMFVLGQCAWAASVGEVLAQELNAIHSLSADFQQRVTAKHHVISQASGQMDLWKPGRFRWETKTPFKQLIIADGRQVWIADIELEQVTLQAQQHTLKGTPALFLGDSPEQLLKDYEVRVLSGAPQTCYRLTAHSAKSAFESLTLCFQAHQLTEIQWVDHLAQHTQLILHHVKQNTTLPISLFTYHIPRGFDVIRQ